MNMDVVGKDMGNKKMGNGKMWNGEMDRKLSLNLLNTQSAP